MALPGDAVELADDHGQPRHPRAQRGAEHLGAGAHDALPLLFRPHHEARLVGEVDHRQVEGVAQLQEADHLGAGGHVHGAAEALGVVDHHPHRIAVHAGQADDARAPVERGDLEEGIPVQHRVQDPVGVVHAALLPRDGGQQEFVSALRVVAGFHPGWQPPHVVRQIAEEALDLLEGVGLGVREVVDHAALVHLAAFVAEILLADVDAEGGLHHRRPAGKHLADALHHHVEVGEAGIHRWQPGHGTEHRRGHRHFAEQILDARGDRIGGNVGAPDLLEGLDAAAGGVEQADVGQPPVPRHLLGVAALVADGRVRGAAAHGEVASGEHRPAAVDGGEADHHVRRAHVGELVAVVGRGPGQGADLLEGARVRQEVYALADGELAPPPLLGDAGLAAHLRGERPAAIELLDFGFPDHPAATPIYGLGRSLQGDETIRCAASSAQEVAVGPPGLRHRGAGAPVGWLPPGRWASSPVSRSRPATNRRQSPV